MNKLLIVQIFSLLLFSIVSWANSIPQQLVVPGGVFITSVAEISQPVPKVFFKENRVSVTSDTTHWIALVGLPLSIKAGEHQLIIKTDKNTEQKVFSIVDKDYPAQYITIKKKRMVSGFTEEDLKKINADTKAMTKAKATWTEQNIDTAFIAPVDGRLSSLFGLKRFYNDIAKRPHNGLDIAAPTGTPIVAPATAKVIDVGNYYFNGNTVFLDHGQGLLSAYLHMNKIGVKPGQIVKQGESLGTVGETGRVTGPHLHWIVYLNNTPVDPALFIATDIPRLDARNKK